MEITCPFLPNRPVRPERCRYVSASGGKSKWITCAMPSKSKPRAARSLVNMTRKAKISVAPDRCVKESSKRSTDTMGVATPGFLNAVGDLSGDSDVSLSHPLSVTAPDEQYASNVNEDTGSWEFQEKEDRRTLPCKRLMPQKEQIYKRRESEGMNEKEAAVGKRKAEEIAEAENSDKESKLSVASVAVGGSPVFGNIKKSPLTGSASLPKKPKSKTVAAEISGEALLDYIKNGRFKAVKDGED